MKRYTEKSLSPDASDLNHQKYLQGCNHYDSGRFRRAASAFQEALEYRPLDTSAWHALGNCYDELNDAKKAEACFRKFLKLADGDQKSVALYNLGNSLLDQDKLQEAVDSYLQVSPESIAFERAQKNLSLARDLLADQKKMP